MSMTFKTSLPLRSDTDADAAVAEPLRRAREQMGVVPNMYAAMANLPALLDAYRHGYELFRGHAEFTPAEQEVLLLAISLENECDYCVAAHSFLADKSGVPTEFTDAIRSDRPIADVRLEALRSFAQTMVRTRGNPTTEDAKRFLGAGYSEKHILGVILAIGVKTLSNYTNHIFHTDLDAAFASRRWTGADQDAEEAATA
ncbi:MAG: carboxymuconolactone decarboxylase family protein [Sphingomonas sp.]|nr:carboxymuconolactone decarboxylase family protein [Sphingomonas sp.]